MMKILFLSNFINYVKVIYNDKLVYYKVVIWVFCGVILWKETEASNTLTLADGAQVSSMYKLSGCHTDWSTDPV